MVRWQPGALERLSAAALDLFEQQGYEQTTVAQVAERAGVTERTFYRYFGDKREVLFSGREALEQALVAAVAASTSTDAADLIDGALAALAGYFPDQRRAFARRRQAVLESDPALLERELLKLQSLRTVMADALTRRGLDDQRAELVAATVGTVFHTAFARWLTGADMATAQADALAELRAIVAG